MKQAYFVLLVLLFSFKSSCQTIQQIDSVTIEMCKSIATLDGNLNSKTKVNTIFNKHLPDFYRKMGVSTQVEADSLMNRIYFRLQFNCRSFVDILDQLEENKSDWKLLENKPLSKISTNNYKAFLKGGNFYYKEYNGAIVKVNIANNLWTETFADNTISKLNFIPKDGNQFDLKFIESNNETRKYLSIKGDMYSYGIFSKNENCYDIWVVTKDNKITSFKLYWSK